MRLQSLQDLHLNFPDIDGYWEHENLTQTEEKIRSTLPPGGGASTSSEIESLSQLTRVLCLQGKLTEASLTLADYALQLERLSKEDKVRPEIRFYLEQGRYFCFSKSPTKALEAFKKAWLLAEKSNLPFFSIDAAYMFSITTPQKMGREWLLRAIEIALRSEDLGAVKWLPHLYMMEAWHSFDFHQFDLALAAFDNALGLCKQSNSSSMLRNLQWCRARTLRALGRPEEALKIQEKILEEMEKTGDNIGFVYLEIAECWQELRHPSKAKPFFELAFERLKNNNWYSDNYVHELARIQKNSKK